MHKNVKEGIVLPKKTQFTVKKGKLDRKSVSLMDS